MAQAIMKRITSSSIKYVVGVTKRAGAQSFTTTSKAMELTRDVPPEEKVTKSVFMSQSTDIYSNLALEDCIQSLRNIFRNMDFTNHHVMMLWRIEPCVVIGRHQNPWLEANIPLLSEKEISLARRYSGGGTVYHDRGNLNITIFTPKARYDRKYNPELIRRALFREFGVKSSINERHDVIVRDKYKVSRTAAKLARLSGYHHCTLLVNANKADLSKVLAKREVSGAATKLARLSGYHRCTLLVNANKADLSKALAKREHGIQSKATESIRSDVVNLAEIDNRITVDSLQVALGYEYLRTPALHLDDGGQNLISKQRGFRYVNHTDGWFPGLAELKNELQSWDWCYGKTPSFTVSRTFPVPAKLLAPSKVYTATQELAINMMVENGLISDVNLKIPPGLLESGFHGEASVITHLKGQRFTSEALNALQEAMLTRHVSGDVRKLDEKEQFVAKCFDQVVNTM